VSGQPNQTVNVDGVTVVINEQSSPRNGDITVNALHITVTTLSSVAGPVDVVVASAHADIKCPPPPTNPTCQPHDFVTGGGWIPTSGGKANFAVGGGVKNGGLWGHLEYDDHAGTKAHGTGVTAYSGTGNARHIEGNAEINGLPGTYSVDVTDNGSPG